MKISMQVELNLNNRVYVKLTDEGRAYLKSYIEAMNLPSEDENALYKYSIRADGEGWTRYQLWELMHIFGPIMNMGNPVAPFEGNIRIGEKTGKVVKIVSA